MRKQNKSTKNNAESKSGVFRRATKREKMRKGVKREKRRGRKSGLAVVPAARLIYILLLIGVRRLKVGIRLRFYGLVRRDGRSGKPKYIVYITNATPQILKVSET